MGYIVIAHRANIEGPSISENTLEKVYECFSYGLDVELDIWHQKGSFWLGHDEPTYKLSEEDTKVLIDNRVWCHAKNLEAAYKLKNIHAHYFWHQHDDFTLTSEGFFWTYPGKELCEHSIAVMPEDELHKHSFEKSAGVCTDFPLRYINYK